VKKNKQCSIKGCTNITFSKDKCLYHYRMGLKPLRRTPLKHGDTRIAKRSKKRQYEEDILYKEAKRIRKRELILLNRWFCLFCGKKLPQCPTWHHTRGRDGELLIKKEFLYPAHFKCHVTQYHQLPISKIPWWNNYVKRIKVWDPELYKKELIKIDKAND